MLLAEYFRLKEALKHCPVCSWRLYENYENRAILQCDNHGKVFAIVQTVTGYRVEVSISNEDSRRVDAALEVLPGVFQASRA